MNTKERKKKLEKLEGEEPGREWEWKELGNLIVDAVEEVCGREQKGVSPWTYIRVEKIEQIRRRVNRRNARKEVLQ